MKHFLAHFRFLLSNIIRNPGYLISTLIFPSLFLVVFGVPNIDGEEMANRFTLSFAAFGVLGVVFFDSTIQTVNQRTSTWEGFVRTLPLNGVTKGLGALTTNLILGLTAAILVFATSSLATEVSLSALQALMALGILVVGSVPFALMSSALASFVRPQSALPIANMIYLILSFSGGLWLPPEAMPEWLMRLSWLTPTRHLGEWLWSTLDAESEIPWMSLATLGAYTLVFGLLIYWQKRRFESLNYN